MANFKTHSADAFSLAEPKTASNLMQNQGFGANKIIEASSLLLGMVLRTQDLTSPVSNPEHLYKQVVNDIQTIERSLELYGYEHSVIIVWRYVMCTFIDECIMSAKANLAEFWSYKSLLVHFHNEASGGEKVFHITERLLGEHKRYKDILEFIYLCFSLGLRGRYKIYAQNNAEFDGFLHKLHAILFSKYSDVAAKNDVKNATASTYYVGECAQSSYQLTKQITVKHFVIATCVILIVAHFVYAHILNNF